MANKNIREEIQCPVCLEIPEDKIFLCQNGHTICETCLIGLTLCPQCRVSYATVKVRNRTLEVLLDSIQFPCNFSHLGCPEEFLRKDLKKHSIKCKYSGKLIQVCCDIGFNCKYSINLLNMHSAMQHFKDAHCAIIRKDLFFTMDLKHFDNATTRRNKKKYLDSLWTPIFINHTNSNQNQPCTSSSATKSTLKPSGLLLLSFIHGNDKSSSWMLVRLSDDKQGQQYHVQFEIQSQSKKVSDLSWRVPAINVTDISVLATQAPFRISNHLLLQHYIHKDGTLSVSARIIPLGKRESCTMSLETATLINILFQHNQCNVTPNQSSQQSMGENSGTTCQECGSFQIKDVKYRKLYSADNSVCNDCVTKKSLANRWYAVLRKLEHRNNQNHVSNLWKNKQEEWKKMGLKELLFQGLDDVCCNLGCDREAIYTCLECKNTNFCDNCSTNLCVDHLLAVFIKGCSIDEMKDVANECQAIKTPSFKCNDCQSQTPGMYYYSLQAANVCICTMCIQKPEHNNKWFALITDERHAKVADDLWLNKIIYWTSSGILPLQNYKICTTTKGCSDMGVFACLECDVRKHYCVCEICFNLEDDENGHLFARYVSQDE